MAFWKNFGFITHSEIETILDKPDFTLEDLLNENELLQEIKHNSRLIDYMSKPEQLEKLLNYAINPPENDDKRSAAPYGYSRTPWNAIACEIICADSPQISNSFLDHPPLFERILNVLEEESNKSISIQKSSSNERDILLAILSKILVTYLPKKPSAIINLMKKRENMVDVFTRLLYNRDVIEVLLKIIEENSEGTSQWLLEDKLIDKLIEKFDPALDSDIYINVAHTLERIITIVSNKSMKSPILSYLERSEIIQKILDYGFSNEENPKSKLSLLHGLTVIIKLIECAHESEESDDSALTIYNVCSEYLVKFLSILEYNKQDSPHLDTTIGKIEPFGYLRMKIILLLEALISSRHEPTINLLIEKNIFKVILDLFFYFEWNNFLHLRVNSIVRTILNGPDDNIKKYLLAESGLIERMIDAHENSLKQTLENKKIPKRGYVGVINDTLTLILRYQKEEGSNIVKEILEKNELWNNYMEKHKELYDDLITEKKLGKLPSIQSASDDDIYHENNNYLDNDGDWGSSDSDDEEIGSGSSSEEIDLDKESDDDNEEEPAPEDVETS